MTATEALGHPWFDGVLVSWGSGCKLQSVLSINTFQRILSSNDKPALSPRSQLQQLGGRHSATRMAAASLCKGPLSFDSKRPTPLLGAVVRQSSLNPGLRAPPSGKKRHNPLIPNTPPDEDL